MAYSFPKRLIPLLRCPGDAGELALSQDAESTSDRVIHGTLQCLACRQEFLITDGVVRFVGPEGISDAAAEHERRKRDDDAERYDEITSDDDVGLRSTLAAVGQPTGSACLELGCGTGRFTLALTRVGIGPIIAVDFSAGELRVLSRKLASDSQVGLVQADVASFHVAPGRFGLVLSTLVSNLPNADYRSAMFRLAATALSADGRFVFSTHHHCFRCRYRKEPQEGRYSGNGVYRYLFREHEIVGEAERSFGRVRARPVGIYLPFVSKPAAIVRRLNRLAERVPVVRGLGELLLVVADRPKDNQDNGAEV